MNAHRACQIINDVIYKPGWIFEARVSERFENTIYVHVEWDAPDYTRENAPDYIRMTKPMANYVRMCTESCTEEDILDWLFHSCIMASETHEAREAFRLRSTLDAPYHPHRQDGMKRFGDPQADLMFGLA